jgi:hypothetical protein
MHMWELGFTEDDTNPFFILKIFTPSLYPSKILLAILIHRNLKIKKSSKGGSCVNRKVAKFLSHGS